MGRLLTRYKTWVIQPNQSVSLFDEDWQVRGRRVRIWAEGVNTGSKHLTQEVWIAPVDGYLGTQETTFA